MTILGSDGKQRCFGREGLMACYHDKEWGIPSHDDRHLFEFLILEGAQAGLNWETVLKKRAAYAEAFHHFDPQLVARMSDQDLEERLQNPGIIRNRLKVFSTRTNARKFLDIQETVGSFDTYLWDFVNGQPIINHWNTKEEVPASTPLSDKISKDLKKRGMTFVGSVIIYAYLQAVGVVNDHLKGCWRYGC